MVCLVIEWIRLPKATNGLLNTEKNNLRKIAHKFTDSFKQQTFSVTLCFCYFINSFSKFVYFRWSTCPRQFNGALRDIDRENNILFIISLFLFNSLFDCLMYTKTCNDIEYREYNMTCFSFGSKDIHDRSKLVGPSLTLSACFVQE